MATLKKQKILRVDKEVGQLENTHYSKYTMEQFRETIRQSLLKLAILGPSNSILKYAKAVQKIYS